ncbi:flagellin [Actibacterium sp. 188UL27-1]|uniref:flagellin n=1 Tax=Actibacterium sp. 188UL27-1 TaxID=2786961 RepID=UPI00195D5E18|nr:flagellin [Actibacterium sp. 188UL27-1]MBM7069862.1 hypothetical protein [Actibacterium sp. 188UL27-1]
MSAISLGDLAQSFAMRRQNTALKTELNLITQEIGSGRVSDLAKEVRGDLNPITGIEHDLSKLEAYGNAITESGLFASTLQNALGVVQSETQDLASSSIAASETLNGAMAGAAGTDAYQTFKTVISALNTNIGDRSILAGIATDGPALAEPDDILDALAITISGETTAAGVSAQVDAWFAPAGGFETVGYQGSNTALSPVQIGPGRSADLNVTALDDRIIDTLKALALGALVESRTPTLAPQEQLGLIGQSGLDLTAAQTGLSTLRGEVGSVEAAIEDARQSNQTEKFGLELARAQIVEVDPYEQATKLQSAQSQLEALYAVTARLSQLSLTNYLR